MIVPEPALAPDAIRAARGGIDPVFLDSAQFVHTGLSARLGVPVIVKVETVNPIRSFKGRGTWVAIQALAGEGRIGPERAIACVSAGNFGQGVAYAARARGIPAIVAAPVEMRTSSPSTSSSAPYSRAYASEPPRASSKSSPRSMTVAPNARMRATFARFARVEQKTTAGTPRARAA